MNTSQIHASRLWSRCAAIAVVGVVAAQVPAQVVDARPVGPADGPVLRLKQGDVVLNRDWDPQAFVAERGPTSTRYVVQFDRPIRPADRARLDQAGIRLGDYLPDNAYIVNSLSQADVLVLGEVGGIRAVVPFETEWKLDPNLGMRAFETGDRAALAADGWYQIVIVLFAGEDVGPAVVTLEQAGAVVSARTLVGGQWMLDSVAPMNGVVALAEVPAVQYIEEAPELVRRNNTNRWIIQSNNDLGHTPIWDAGIHGENQIAGIIDGTIKESHCMFDDTEPIGPTHRKIVALRNPDATSSHGTHVAGILCGDEDPYDTADTYDGIAYSARISFSEDTPIYSDPSTLYDRLLDAHNDGARVHSNSWGDDGTTAYTTWCRQIDDFTYAHEDDLVLFAVSNGTSIKTPENAKNVLAVSASQDAPNQDYHCIGGKGPTPDGRRKPEVMAPGCSTRSASSTTLCSTTPKTGTSMACPAVAGAAVLTSQYFLDGYYPTGTPTPADSLTPSGALLKAVMVNAAVDMTGITGYPSTQEGWGRVLLDNGLYLPGDDRRLSIADVRNADGLATGGSSSYTAYVLGNSEPLRLTMVYTEPPASVNASDPVINNLDLEVVAPDGTTYQGNWFVGGESATGGAFDDRNNVEQVLRDLPLTGRYTVNVLGTEVNQGSQGFAMVLTGDAVLSPLDCQVDQFVDLNDFDLFATCLSGPDTAPIGDCTCADVDNDGDVDLADYAVLTEVFDG